MKNLSLLLGLFALFLLPACENTEATPPAEEAPGMSADEARSQIDSLIQVFLSTYSTKNPDNMAAMVTDDLHFFGTDSAEVITNSAGFREQMSNDFKLFETARFEAVRHRSIVLDEDNELASAVFEVPVTMTAGEQSNRAVIRFAQTFRREGDSWRLVQGMASFPSRGQSSAELVAKMNAD